MKRRSFSAPTLALAAMAAVSGSVHGAGSTTPPASATATPLDVLVELNQEPTAVAYRHALQRGKAAARTTAIDQLARVHAEQLTVRAAVALAGLPATRELYRLQRVFNGVVYRTTTDQLDTLRRLPGVRDVRVLTPKTLLNAYSVPFLGVPAAWSAASPLHGEGVKVGIIDTGIDYTHADLGGSGDPAEFEVNDPTTLAEGNFPTLKVGGGYDFVGSAYDASSTATATLVPDPDPMDYDGHGSHVAATVAGLGVTADGQTYAGPYDATLDASLAIGPGMAPAAELYALKVFGDGGGTTSAAPLAVEWSVDPNGDGDFDDRLDVVNLSLGGTYGTSTEADAEIYRNAVLTGLVVVAAAGNSGDVYFISGSPGAIPEVISVAASEHDHMTYAGLMVTAPPSLAGKKLAGVAAFGPGAPTPITGDVVAAKPLDACTTLDSPETLAGKIAIVRRGTCTFESKVAAVQAAGAIGAVVVNNQPGKPITMGDDLGRPIDIPAFMLGQTDGEALIAAIPAETVTVTLSDAFYVVRPEDADTVAGFSSRGPTRHDQRTILKPDVAAPGVAIVSVAAGSGTGGATMSGTSMASPHVAGVMALLRQAHPDWSVMELKALVMNTAHNDLYLDDSEPRPRVSPLRMGAGRVDVPAAIASPVIAYDLAAPAQVSLSFATGDVAGVIAESRTVQLRNKSAAEVTYTVGFDPVVTMAGVSVTGPAGASVVVPAGGTVDVAVVLHADAAQMVRGRDQTVSEYLADLPRNWLSETSGFVVFQPTDPGLPELRVPYFAAPAPASTMSAAAGLATDATAGTATLTLAGEGVDTISEASPAPVGVRSVVTPFELLYANPDEPPLGQYPPGYPEDETNRGAIQYLGVMSDLADRGGVVADTTIFVGVVMHGTWTTPLQPGITIDLRGAGETYWHYQLFNSDVAWAPASGQDGADLPACFLLDLQSLEQGMTAWINGVAADWYYLPTFHADAVVLAVPASALGLTEENPRLELRAQTRHLGNGDVTPVLTYDVRHPGLMVQADPAVGLPAGAPPLRLDQSGASIDVAYDLAAARANLAGGLLLIHHLNAAGARGEIVPVQGLTCVSDDDCGSADRPICAPQSGVCVGCTTTDDCEGGARCDTMGSRRCDCRITETNPCDPGAYCDAGSGVCVFDCTSPDARSCPAGAFCNREDGGCLPVNTLVVTSPEPAGVNCAAGGVKIESGLDTDGDLVLDVSEVDTTTYVCNGSSSLIAVTEEPAGVNCAAGGKRIQTGVDADGDRTLDPEEVAETSYLCDGEDGDGGCGVTGSPARGAGTATEVLAGLALLLGSVLVFRQKRRG